MEARAEFGMGFLFSSLIVWVYSCVRGRVCLFDSTAFPASMGFRSKAAKYSLLSHN